MDHPQVLAQDTQMHDSRRQRQLALNPSVWANGLKFKGEWGTNRFDPLIKFVWSEGATDGRNVIFKNMI